MKVHKSLQLLGALVMFAASSSTFAQMNVTVELDEIDNKTDEVLVLGVGKKNFHIAPRFEYDADMKITMVAHAPLAIDGITPRTLPRFKNQDPITIKHMNPMTKQMSELYTMSIEAFVIKVDGKHNLQVSVSLKPKDTNRALIEWTEIFDAAYDLELDIKLTFEKMNGIIVHKGDTLDIEVDKKD